MTPEQIAEMQDTLTAYGEFLGGFRRNLVEQHGFSSEIAEQLVLEAMRGAKNATKPSDELE